MSFLQSMQHRYTTKEYDGSKKIDPQKIDDLKEILRLSPSSINSQPWKFTFVSDEETKKKLSTVSKHNTDKLLNCDTVIILSRIEDITLFEEQVKNELPPDRLEYYNAHLKSRPAEELRNWFGKQVYLALGILLSACAEMDIDSTPMEGIEGEKYDEILELNGYKALVAVTIGHRTEDDFNQPSKKPKLRMALDKVVKTI
ncbi:MAG: nitroreductase/dihydropteridine reductase [Spirosomataceae bacterium]|jgi:nitroreductase/dihydropteridine reductase